MYSESLPNRSLSLKFDMINFDFVNYLKFFNWAIYASTSFCLVFLLRLKRWAYIGEQFIQNLKALCTYFYLVIFIVKTNTLHCLTMTLLFTYQKHVFNLCKLTNMCNMYESCVWCMAIKMLYSRQNVYAFLETHNRSAQTLINTYSVNQEQIESIHDVSSYKEKNPQTTIFLSEIPGWRSTWNANLWSVCNSFLSVKMYINVH